MKRLIAIWLAIGLAFAHLLLPPSARSDLSLEEERKLGERFMRAARHRLKFIPDSEVTTCVDETGQRVVRAIGPHPFPYHFYVVDSSVLNAFAAPAGHVFVNRGLLEIMDDQAELAAILAHEIAHVQSRHLAERLGRAQKLNLATLGGLLAAIFLGGPAGQALAVGSVAGNIQTQLHYSRQDEEEADRKGLRYLESAGIAPVAMVKIMQKMSQESWKGGGRLPAYLSTHPGVAERVNYLSAVLETRNGNGSRPIAASESGPCFLLLKAKLLGTYADPNEADNILRSWVQAGRNIFPAYYGLGLLERRRGRMQQAVAALRRAAALRPDEPMVLVELAQTYFLSGHVDRALEAARSALSLEEDLPEAHYVLGRVLLEQDRPEEAIVHLERACKVNSDIPAIHYYLGVAYGRRNRLALAHEQFGHHFQNEGEWRTALFHYREALRLTSEPEKRRELREKITEVLGQQRQDQPRQKPFSQETY